MNKCQQPPAHICAKQDKPAADKGPNFYNKKKQAVQKLIELASLFDQDIYIAIKDKKTNKLTEYSSGEGFQLQQVASQLLAQNKQDKKATQGLKDILEAFKKVLDEEESTVETSSTESKTTPEKTDGADERCADDQNMVKPQIGASPFPCGKEDTGSLLIQNQLSQDEQEEEEEAALGSQEKISIFKQLEAITKAKVDPAVEDLVEDEEARGSDSFYLSHAKRCTDFDDVFQRVNSIRGDFAQKHLFKCGFKEDEIAEDLSDAVSESQSVAEDSEMEVASSYSEEEVLSTGTMSNSIQNNVEAGLPSAAGSNYNASCELSSHESSLPISTKTVRNENNSKVKTQDMLFFCADWQNLYDAPAEEAKGEKLSGAAPEQPKQCKRKIKQQEKQLPEAPSKLLPLKRSKPLENIDVTALLSTQQAEPCIKRRVTSNIAGLPLKPLNLQLEKAEGQTGNGGETQSLSPMGHGAHAQASAFSAVLLKK